MLEVEETQHAFQMFAGDVVKCCYKHFIIAGDHGQSLAISSVNTQTPMHQLKSAVTGACI
jgi:hypothetical protein